MNTDLIEVIGNDPPGIIGKSKHNPKLMQFHIIPRHWISPQSEVILNSNPSEQGRWTTCAKISITVTLSSPYPRNHKTWPNLWFIDAFSTTILTWNDHNFINLRYSICKRVHTQSRVSFPYITPTLIVGT